MVSSLLIPTLLSKIAWLWMQSNVTMKLKLGGSYMKNANDFMGSTMDKIVLGGGFIGSVIVVILDMCGLLPL